MRTITKCIVVTVLLASAACSKADMSDARRDYLLAKDHGWLDLVIKAPPEGAGYDESKACTAVLAVNGETLLTERVVPAAGDEGLSGTGYRIVAPAGKARAELHLSGCVTRDVAATVSLVIDKDHLSELVYSGSALSAGAAAPYAPASLDAVRGDLRTLQQHGESSDAALSTLTRLVYGCLALNVLGILLFVILRRRS